MTTLVPANIDATNWSTLKPIADTLLARQVHTPDELRRWLEDRSEFEAAVSEAQANLFIAMTCHTDDESAQKAYTDFIEGIPPRLKPVQFALDKRFVELAAAIKPDPKRHEVIVRDTRAGVELFREENVPIETELARLEQKFEQISGAMGVEFEGRERTMAEMAVFQESLDRTVRERAWLATAQRRLRDASDLHALYSDMIERRDRVAKNAGFDNYVGFAFKSKLRFDYSPDDCRRFHDAIERTVVPFNDRQSDRRRKLLKLDSLRPWDVSVDPLGRPPLRPFKGGRQLVARTAIVFDRLDARLAEMFRELTRDLRPGDAALSNCLDLDSRKGKGPGGYQYMRDRSRVPFIFMNAAGVHRDVETMVHEAGHAFHSMRCADEPLLHYRHAPIEFCEVASMSMELLTMRHWGAPGAYYPDQGDHQRAMRRQIEGTLGTLPWIATIDAFQHWIYSNPRHTIEQRTQAWLALDERFGYAGRFRVDFDDLDPALRQTYWQKQGHLYGVPFYYIEYGIAQLGALQLWVKSLEQGEKAAVDAYLAAMKLGGSRPLPELFAAADIRFDFSEDLLGRLVERVESELEKLPE
ncbi:MAG: M3 family oligoendopeptidase [Phycisphaeraceae bacterium]|nr:M3 family oligoendopeptidase [Phycisphaeraceae bacterium]